MYAAGASARLQWQVSESLVFVLTINVSINGGAAYADGEVPCQ